MDILKNARIAINDLDILSHKIGYPGELERASRLLVAVFNTISEITPIRQSLHFISPMPVFFKGVYVSGMDYDRPKRNIKHENDFINEVRRRDIGRRPGESEWITRQNVCYALNFLKRYLGKEELDGLLSTWPEELQAVWDQKVVV